MRSILPPRPPLSNPPPPPSSSSVAPPKKPVLTPEQQERALIAKSFLEQKYQSMRADRDDSEKRRLALEDQIKSFSEEDKQRYRKELSLQETQRQRAARKTLSVDNDFILLRVIGKGAFGQVRLVKKKDTGEIFALKTMVKKAMVLKNQVTHVRAERNILATHGVNTKYLVELENSFQDNQNLYLLMEYLPGGDLMGLLMKENILSEPASKFYIAETILAVECVHAMGYIHRDLKPDNLLLDWKGHIKLTDLGLCKKIEDGIVVPSKPPPPSTASVVTFAADSSNNNNRYVRDRKQAFSTVGTPDYISVEVLAQNGYGMGCDWWSVGIILFECLFGYPPFFADDPMQTCRRIMGWKDVLKFPVDKTPVSPEAIQFLKRLICDPDTRLGIKGGSAELKSHAFFNKVDFDALREMDAPFIPKFSMPVEQMLTELRTRAHTDPVFTCLIDEITCNFDTFPDEPLPGETDAPLGRSLGGWSDPKFLGFAFNNTRKNTPPPVIPPPAAAAVKKKQ